MARRGHLSVVTFNELITGKPSHLLGLVLMKDARFEEQRAVVIAGMNQTFSNVGFGDATGLGMESNEVLAKKYRERWTPHTFSGPGKRAVASALKTGFTNGVQTLPPLES